jgi:Cof subfamily protein (haloacid dehalogenase superfamily)
MTSRLTAAGALTSRLAAIRLVLIDVDGTLVGPNGVPDQNWQAARQARERGVRLGMCTGRSGVGHAMDYARRLDPEGLHIFDSGAAILDGGGRVHHGEALDRDLFAVILEIARREALDFEVYTADGGYFIAAETPELVAHQRGLGRTATVIDLDRIPGAVVRTQFVATDLADWPRVRATLASNPALEIHEATGPSVPHALFATVTRRGVSKRSAALRVAAHYGLPDLDRVAMVGDGENDLELIRAAGLGIAMANASPSVRAAAQLTVGHVEDAGLGEALRLITSSRA